jgi:hypothetical protein
LEPDTWIHPQHEGDSFIMEDFTNLVGLKPIKLVHAQRCRLFLGVTTLADICSSNGTEISEWAINGQDSPTHTRLPLPLPSKPICSHLVHVAESTTPMLHYRQGTKA